MITVTIVTTGTVAKSLRQNPSNITGKHEINLLKPNVNYSGRTVYLFNKYRY